jgi:hypothetical protein
LRHILSKIPDFHTCKGIPTEETRTQVSAIEIENWFLLLQGKCQNIPAHFLFNMDEMGHQSWADAHSHIVYVPFDHTNPTTPIATQRTGRRITLVAGIGLDGSYLKPLIIIPRKSIEN